MLKILTHLLHKIKDYDNLDKKYNELYEEANELKILYNEVSVHNLSYELTLKETERELKEKKESIAYLKKRGTLIELPVENVKSISKVLEMADKFTLNAIIQYLKLDSYEMVKNMPASLKEDNAVQLIAYVD